MSNEIKLLPCPFCGGEADLIEQKHREYASTYYVRCKGCHCKSLERMGVGIVVEAWNTRKPMDDIVEQLEQWTFEADVIMPLGDIMKNRKLIASGNAIDIVKAGGTSEC